ncbi:MULTISPECIES: Mce protein [Mycobacteriaceae]|uniref:Mce protein n=1 Tax=Mycolicibacterium parafortuitum TaxID=39692 RepID=A0ACC6MCF7_MYCPF|nr:MULTISPECIES: Mce protein [Mycobacteriaceae]MBX7455280.1 Mce protein [Mycolicibacterium aurantiacum]MEC9323878.1 Mce protein [Actinomycetota bacterium]MDZ5084644.1 Mce protein [Mycolicibacterium parafortuitum]BBA72655.1 MCE associated membrane protein [Mycobacterium sp. PO1]BBA72707.1 MCE associated membrane protein [Mycobacterium sp. PO2]
MADDAAAPDGELTTSRADSAGTTDKEASGAVEPDSTASDVPETGKPESAATAEAATATNADEDAEAEDTEAEDTEAEGTEEADDAEGVVADEAAPARAPMSHVKIALIAGLVAVVALAGLTGWLGFQAYQAQQTQDLRSLYLQVGRQGALNLTTIGYENAEADVQRILDSATGTFYDDFQRRAEPFVEVVKQAQSTSEGTIAEAGLESFSDNEAQVLVAVTVRTSNAGAPDQAPRAWRMRISVEKVGDEAKVSNVEFVP